MADVLTLLDGVSANGTGPVIDAGDLKDEVGVQVEAGGGVSAFSVEVDGSLDGTNWFTVEAAVTDATAETMATGILARYFRAILTGYTGAGTLTCKIAVGKT